MTVLDYGFKINVFALFTKFYYSTIQAKKKQKSVSFLLIRSFIIPF